MVPTTPTPNDAAPHELPEPLLSFESAGPALHDALDRIDTLRARYNAAHAAGRVLANTVDAIRVELTYHSNAIEGNTLTLRDTQLVIEGRAPEGGKSLREIYEARNHHQALRLLETWAAQRPAVTPLTERDLLELSAVALADLDPPAAGRFRSERVLIAGSSFIPPGPQRFPVLIPRLLQLASRPGLHPVLQAAELHYNIAAVHPFRDGNGRTARLLMNYHLLARGCPHTIIEVTQRAAYLAALDEANAGRPERFSAFIAASVEQSIRRILPD